MKNCFYTDSPLGRLYICDNGLSEELAAVTRIDIEKPEGFCEKKSKVIVQAERELSEYFSGKRKEFSVKLSPEGTDFQKRVWEELVKIPFGTWVCYSYIAEAIGSPKGSRAVGGAVGRNPILIMVPCHRVLAKDGSIGGFSAGLDKKRVLLKTEDISVK